MKFLKHQNTIDLQRNKVNKLYFKSFKCLSYFQSLCLHVEIQKFYFILVQFKLQNRPFLYVLMSWQVSQQVYWEKQGFWLSTRKKIPRCFSRHFHLNYRQFWKSREPEGWQDGFQVVPSIQDLVSTFNSGCLKSTSQGLDIFPKESIFRHVHELDELTFFKFNNKMAGLSKMSVQSPIFKWEWACNVAWQYQHPFLLEVLLYI